MAAVVDPAKVESAEVTEAGARGLSYQALVEGVAGRRLTANLVTVAPGGITRNHRHEWEQVNFILDGEGMLETPAAKQRVARGMLIHVPGDEPHFYVNTGKRPLVILGVLGPMPAAS